MRRVFLPLLLVTCVVVRAGALTQAKPDFAGSWVFDPAHSSKEQGFRTGTNGTFTPVESNRPAAPAFGNGFTASQSETALTIRYTVAPTMSAASSAPVNYRFVYALDGSETHNTVPSGRADQPDTETVSTAAWDGGNLVITIQRVDLAGAGRQVRTLHLGSDGSLLVDTTTPGPNGAPAATTTTAYTKPRIK